MKLTKTRGYLSVGLSENGRPSCHRVHRLVWTAHVGLIPNGHVINHMNGDKADNRLMNLECITNAANIRHAFRVLGRDRGGSAKLSLEKVESIRIARAGGEPLVTLAREHGVTEACISSVCTGKTWKQAQGPITPARGLRETPQAVMARISPETIENVRLTYADGGSPTALALELGVSKRTILNWCQGKTRSK